jgi:SpoVK/Ycf46/Vps4 family AAA+-type ATPase
MHECHDQIAVWMLRILLDLNTWESLHIEYNKGALKAVGLSSSLFDKCDQSGKKQKLKMLLNQAREVCNQQNKGLDKMTYSNLKWLQKLVDLNDVEVEILLFAICLTTSSSLQCIASDLGELSKSAINRVLAVILDISVEEISSALSVSSNLLNCGLLTLEQSKIDDLESTLLVSGAMTGVLSANSSVERQKVINQFFNQSHSCSLTLSDYPHLKSETTLLKSYLSAARKKKLLGVNILIYGAPGTGKTELVGALAKAIRTELYTVSIADSAGNDLKGSERVKAYKMAQQVLARGSQSLLLFDEIEDVFPTDSFFVIEKKGPGKAWFNNLLETNVVPTFWLSNDIREIDKAYIRRFDFVLELKIPPKLVRKKILQSKFSELNISKHWIDQMSKDNQLAAGVVTRAAKVLNILPELGGEQTEACLSKVLGNTLRAMGHRIEKVERNSLKPDYKLEAINPSYDIQKLIEGLQTVSGSRVCLYGPPGTGKTAFGHHLSEELNKPLMMKRASDLLSPYVGVAEKNIAAMFEEAQEEEAILLLDEADSFLQDRSTLKQSWEITQVNELLTQMESFEGTFICSTNLMDKLDSAVLRRFDFKIKLDYITTDQAWVLFCQSVGWNKKESTKQGSWYQKLSTYQNLTPGDFANVLRQQRLFKQKLSPETLMAGLNQESLFKQGTSQSREIGFHATH